MKRADLTNQRFGRLTAQEYVGGKRWKCTCDCGSESMVFAYQLTSGRSQSCGCLRAELMSVAKRKHGMSNTPEWHTYYRMIARCTEPSNARYPRYGGRGVTVCDRWLQSFENFFQDMGRRPEGCSIERKNVNGNYEPSNCIWATQKQQARNTSRTIRITFNGKEQCLADWAAEIGVPYGTLYDRYVRGVPAAEIMEAAA